MISDTRTDIVYYKLKDNCMPNERVFKKKKEKRKKIQCTARGDKRTGASLFNYLTYKCEHEIFTSTKLRISNGHCYALIRRLRTINMIPLLISMPMCQSFVFSFV